MRRYLTRIIFFILPVTRFFKLRRFLLQWSRVKISDDVAFCGGGGILGNGDVSIGSGTWLSPGVLIYSHEDVTIAIGERCDIGPEVKFIPGTHIIGDRQRRAGTGYALDITIEDGCWIGAGTIILGGVTIGSGVVVAAGSVVNKSIPANHLAAGVPAKIKKTLP